MSTPPVRLASSREAAIAAAAALGGPVVLKVSSPDIQHKSDIGGVSLDLGTAQAARAAAATMAQRFAELGPLAVAQSKAALHMSSDADHTTARRIGLEALALCIDGPEWTEGMAAFMAKRPPDFKDRP